LVLVSSLFETSCSINSGDGSPINRRGKEEKKKYMKDVKIERDVMLYSCPNSEFSCCLALLL
jgi:hypothetical protein